MSRGVPKIRRVFPSVSPRGKGTKHTYDTCFQLVSDLTVQSIAHFMCQGLSPALTVYTHLVLTGVYITAAATVPILNLRAGGVNQVQGPKFKLQHHKKQKTEQCSSQSPGQRQCEGVQWLL
jgi:hypothetical protein